ncbi:peptidase M61 [Pandoraea thiooxydans]|uniref:Peptidase M61 n=1 Tax=Pandoraea thiooxydans TaxID=445709 RepID=A0A0G3ESM3_9BURK|nr:M61 family metallopeptidase [Pandoraea thiooxydans]AKJ69930.1 peptidase M61 [Pandoraea thiooxydans]APR97712.1 peptidase M61 [Pandoraea thiooxydans]
MKPIRYSIVPKQPAAHLFEVSVTVPQPDPAGQRFTLPAWIPGSYMVREFARHIVTIDAVCRGRKVALAKLDKHTWQAAPCKGALTLTYQVYAWDLSVRAAHLDQTHGFFNGSSVFLCVAGQEATPCEIDIVRPGGVQYRAWQVATALAPAPDTKALGFGRYLACDYDELIDSPVELGTFAHASFKACGALHEVAITGNVPNLDIARLCRDMKRICETQIKFFEPAPGGRGRAPVSRYVFLVMAVGDGYGGLEHRASTALLCTRGDLPVLGHAAMSEGYRGFLGLVSHEYFHTWNVKRIKPAVFAPYDLARENYTSLLWLFEGFTSYYDDLMLVRSGVIAEQDYFDLLGKTIGNVLRGSGRHKQSVAESSFDAWIKYYRQDENAPNAIVSYYTKGSLIALALDLMIRTRTRGRKSLDDIMRALWQRYGRDFYRGRPVGVREEEVRPLFEQVSGMPLKEFFDSAVHGTSDLPLARLFEWFGVTLKAEPGENAKPSLGVKLGTSNGSCTLAQVHDGGAAQRAGLSAGDALVALDGLRVTASNLDKLLARYRPGDDVRLHAFRRDELHEYVATLSAPEPARYRLSVVKEHGAAARRARWLHG